MKDILTKHKQLVCQYLCANFELFFSTYNEVLIASHSYVTKRQSIKLLGEILLDRANYPVMMAYVDKGKNLKVCMELLRDQRRMIQYEAFHVFKVFVANPKQHGDIRKILFLNKEKLLRFLPRFLEDRTDDDQFTDEKSYLMRRVQEVTLEEEEPASTVERVPSLSVGA